MIYSFVFKKEEVAGTCVLGGPPAKLWFSAENSFLQSSRNVASRITVIHEIGITMNSGRVNCT